jgi:chitosanase
MKSARQLLKHTVDNIHKYSLTTPIILGISTAVVVISLFLLPASAYAETAMPITGIANKCIDVKGGNATNHAKVQLYGCNATVAQTWTQMNDGTLRNQGLCLDIRQGHLKPKTPIQLYTCNGTISQVWSVSTGGVISNPNSGLCLDDMYGITKDGNTLWLYTCNNTPSQKWSLTPLQSTGIVPPSIPTSNQAKPNTSPSPNFPNMNP